MTSKTQTSFFIKSKKQNNQNKIGTKFLVLIGIYAVFNLKTINILMEDKITYKIYSMNAIEFSKCYSIDYARSKPFLFLYHHHPKMHFHCFNNQ